MKIEIKGYFADKWKGTDIQQINALPEDLRNFLLRGTEEEASKTLDNIRARERLQKVTLLGEAALEYISDFRAIRKSR